MEGIYLRRMKDDDEDYKLLEEWFKDSEVNRFYSTHPVTLEEVKEKYRPRIIKSMGAHNIVPMIIMQDDAACGYLQYYPVEYDEYGLGEWEDYIKSKYLHPYAVDIFLGGKTLLDKDIGTESLRILISRIFETTDSDVILIDPNALNKRAVRCYEKAGFHIDGIMKKRDLYKGEYTDSVLMSVSRK